MGTEKIVPRTGFPSLPTRPRNQKGGCRFNNTKVICFILLKKRGFADIKFTLIISGVLLVKLVYTAQARPLVLLPPLGAG